ncbi:MAG TPA: metallophosphoesterase [Polyangia bacterium]|nr:metallophosphoesterase [Polyangia bacterium]
MNNPLRLLHLTDLHFTPSGLPEIVDDKLGNPAMRAKAADDLGNRFIENLKHFLARFPEDDWPKVVVVSGDLVNKGGKAERVQGRGEFERATDFLHRVREALRIEPDRILVVPGNHDVDWSANLSTQERFQAFMDAMRDFTTPKITSDGPEPVLVDLSTIRKGIDVEVLLLVSPTFSGAPDEERKALRDGLNRRLQGEHVPVKVDDLIELRPLDVALIGQRQREKILQRPYKKNIRIAVLHHHVLPDDQLELSPFEAVLDSGRLLEALVSRGFDLIVTGHKHKRRLVQYRARNAETDPDGVIDIYSGPSLFHSQPGGATLISVYGEEHPYYVELEQLESGQQLRACFAKRLVRDRRILPSVVTECARISTDDQKEHVVPVVQSLAEGLARMRGRPKAAALFAQILENQIEADLRDFGNGHLKFRPPNLYERWHEMIALAADSSSGLQLVSNNDLNFWVEAEDHYSAAARYEEPIRSFRGPKERLILIPWDELGKDDVREKWQRVVKRMTDDGIEVRLADPERIVKRSVLDFGIVGDLAVSRFDTLKGVARGLVELFDEESLDTYRRHWKNLDDGVYWDSSRDRSFLDATRVRKGIP